MTRKQVRYACSVCDREVGRDNLAVKKAHFYRVGMNAKFIRSRTMAWLCTVPQPDGSPSCLDIDEHYTAEAVRSAPGGLGTAAREAAKAAS